MVIYMQHEKKGVGGQTRPSAFGLIDSECDWGTGTVDEAEIAARLRIMRYRWYIVVVWYVS